MDNTQLIERTKHASGEDLISTSLVDELIAALEALQARVLELEGQERNKVPEAWTNLLAYVLQGDMHNRLTPRVIDIAYNAFMLAKSANKEDGGASDWFNDTKPAVEELIAKLRKDLVEELESARPVPAAPTALELMTEYSNGKKWALEEAAKVADDSDHIVDVGGYHAQLGDANATQRNIVAAIRKLQEGL